MAYRIANGTVGRRITDVSSGPRTIGYDATPRGLAGTSSTASDYKRNKQKKDEDMVKLGDAPPYDDSPQDDTHGIVYFTEYGDNPYSEELVMLGEGVPNTDGDGWILKATLQKSSSDAKKINMAGGVLTLGKDGSLIYIVDVSDKSEVKLPTAPLENGMVKHDHKVRMPKTLRVVGRVSRSVSKGLASFFDEIIESKSLATYFSLKSPMKDYKKMYLKSYTSKANSTKYDVFDYTLDLQELLLANDLKDTTNDPELANNTDKGAANTR